MLIQQDSSRPEGFMVSADISSCGKTSLRFVRNGERRKMILHQDSAPSHVSKKTLAFLNISKIDYLKPEEWMPKSPDAAPIDYAVWGYLKKRLNNEKIESLDELKKRLLKHWRKISQAYIDKLLAYRPIWVILIYKARGFHREHRLKL